MNTCRCLGMHAAFAFLLAASASADWLQYRGPTQNGIAAEKLPATLSAAPKILWKTRVGLGTASVTVSGDRAFTMGDTDEKNDTIVCLDVRTGKAAWKHELPVAPDPNRFE